MSVFAKEDYNSSNGMQSSVFGPPTWFILHCTSFNYPTNPTEQDKKHYMNFISSFEYTLPCVYCRNNFKSNLKAADFGIHVMENRETFSRFVYNLHNAVNKMLGKKIKISYEEVRDRYEHFRSRCNEKETKAAIRQRQLEEKKEIGCSDSMYGSKSRCILSIVPKESKTKNFKINSKCMAKKVSKK